MPQPSPRFITAAEVAQDEAGDVQGPASSLDGNIALFDGTTGKLLKAAGVVEGVATIDATTNILIGDDAGNAVDSTVPISAIGGSFLSANTTRVDPSGHDEGDDAGVVGDLTKPFLTVQAAVDAILAAAIEGTANGVIDIGANNFTEDIVIDTEAIGVRISFIGRRSVGSVDFTAFNSLNITTPSGASSVEIYLLDVATGGGDIIFDSHTAFLYLDHANCGGANVSNTREAGDSLSVTSISNSGGNIYSITANDVALILVSGIFPYSGGGVISSSGSPDIKILGCSRYSYPDVSDQSLWSVDAENVNLTAIQSILGDVTCSDATFTDSRAVGSITTSNPIVYNDVLLKAVPPGGTTGQALEKASNDDFDTVWNDLA